MSVLERREVHTYDFQNRDDEMKYGFVIKFKPQDEVYEPYLTNSQAAIGLFIDPIEFAEIIQDKGAQYMVTPNAIIFEDEESAKIAANSLIEIVVKLSIEKIEELLYSFAKSNYFGKKEWFIEQLTQYYVAGEKVVDDTVLNNMFNVYTTARENNLYITVYGGNEDKHYHAVSYDIKSGIIFTDENRQVPLVEVVSFYNEGKKISV